MSDYNKGMDESPLSTAIAAILIALIAFFVICSGLFYLFPVTH